MLNQILHGDWIEVLKAMKDESIDMVMTSPPYWGLRDYGVDGQLGLEEHPNEYIKKLVNGFQEVKRVLKKSGSVYLNMGDTYFGGCGGSNKNSKLHSGRNQYIDTSWRNKAKNKTWLQPKQLMLMPSRVAIAFQEDGWILRNDIIWHKPNPMPSSVKDRLNTTFEHVFHFVKARKYYYDLDAIREKHTSSDAEIKRQHKVERRHQALVDGSDGCGGVGHNPLGKNPGDFWNITTQPFPEAHFAVYPEKLCEKPIKASCPAEVCKKCGKARERITKPTKEYAKYLGKSWHSHKKDKEEGMLQVRGVDRTKVLVDVSKIQKYQTIGWTSCDCKAGFSTGIVLDPFAGAGTTCLVAKKLGRNYIGIELKKEYCEIARKRIAKVPVRLSNYK